MLSFVYGRDRWPLASSLRQRKRKTAGLAHNRTQNGIMCVTKRRSSEQADTSRNQSRTPAKAHAQARNTSPPTQANNTTQRQSAQHAYTSYNRVNAFRVCARAVTAHNLVQHSETFSSYIAMNQRAGNQAAGLHPTTAVYLHKTHTLA